MKVQVIGGLRGVSMTSTKLLMSSKSLLADPNAPNMKNQLQLAARAVTESINAPSGRMHGVCSWTEGV
jgi:talin